MNINLSTETMDYIFSEIFKKLMHDRYLRNLFGLFPYGSLNYGLFDSTSDIDFIAPVIPSIQDIATYNNIVEVYDFTVDGISITIKMVDFRDFCRWKNKLQLMEFISVKEGYYYVAEQYKQLWDEIREKREELVSSNCVNIFKAAIGMMNNKTNHTLNTNTNGHYRIYHTARLAFLLRHYFTTGQLEFDCRKLFNNCYEELVNVKNNGISEEEIKTLEKSVSLIENDIECFLNSVKKLGFKENSNNLLDELCIKVLTKNLQNC